MKPNQPPTYKVDNIDVAYTRNQLQVVNEATEKQPTDKANRKFIVEQIINKRNVKNKVEYLVKWQGYADSENTWEPRSTLIKDVAEMVKQYDDSHK